MIMTIAPIKGAFDEKPSKEKSKDASEQSASVSSVCLFCQR